MSWLLNQDISATPVAIEPSVIFVVILRLMTIIKIISGGQNGADQAALDAAIKLGIPHGGWISKGRITETGPLPNRYNLQEMPTHNHPKRTEQNVIDSDGTMIISHGKLTGGSDYTSIMAKKHDRPWIHIDLDSVTVLDASLKINNWIIENSIRVLNVAGSRASEDLKIYEKTKDVVEGIILLARITEKHDSLDRLSADTIVPKTVDDAVSRLISKLSLKDKAVIANMTNAELASLNITLGNYIIHFYRLLAGNEELMASCRFVSKKDVPDEDVASKVIIERLWEKLRRTHKLRVIK